DYAAAFDEVVIGSARIAFEPRGIGDRRHGDVKPARAREPRKHITVAAVVAWTADDEHAPRRRPSPLHDRKSSGTGTCHERIARNVQRFDHMAIELTYLGCRVDSERQRGHGDSVAKRLVDG